MFSKISDIDTSCSSWNTQLYLTFDLDWCSDEVLSYTLDILEEYSVKATIFVTHHTKLLDRMRNNPNIELGIHPNFNFLLNGDFRYGNSVKEVIKYYLQIVPEAISCRSHSLVSSSQILNEMECQGIQYESNTFISHTSQIDLKPWKSNNLVRVPYFFGDASFCNSGLEFDIKQFINYKGVKVFNFHPIHIFLNTIELDIYSKSKAYLQDFNKLKSFINNETYGVKDILLDLINNYKK